VSSVDRASSAAQRLREAFDRAFSAPPADLSRELEPFVLLKVGDGAYAIRVREIRGFAAARRIIPLPSDVGDLLGLAGFRGNLVPVYDLAGLLGHGPLGGPPRWFILCGDAEPLALAFADFDGYAEHSRADLRARSTEERLHVREVLVHGAATRSVINVLSIIQTVQTKVGQGPPPPAALAGETARSPKEPSR
jgi:purine-binding chemotaxis protein CheW